VDEKKRILTTHIFGVDIDPQAVEVSKLSLLLKVLEGETDQSLRMGLLAFKDRALPNLADNIKCGNSLIGPDYFTGRLIPDAEEFARVNAFDWQREFPAVFPSPPGRGQGEGGGFDCIIGNPPYYKVSGRTSESQFNYYRSRYECAGYKTELYALFSERAFHLLRMDGIHGFIVPNSFLAGVYLRPIRSLLGEKNSLIELLMLPNVRVFQDAKLDSVVFTSIKRTPSPRSTFMLRCTDQTLKSVPGQVHSVELRDWRKSPGLEFRVTQTRFAERLARKLHKRSCRLRELASVHLGLVLSSNDLLSETRTSGKPDPILLGRDLGRYRPATPAHWFSFKKDPIVGGTKNPAVYATGPRLVFQAIRNLRLPRRLVGTLAGAGIFTMGTVHNILVLSSDYSPSCILGLLNSRLINAYYAAQFPEHRIKGRYLESLPIARVGLKSRAAREGIARNVDSMLGLHKQLASAKSEAQRGAIQRQIDATDREIDRLVYDLYGLTKEEIVIVENFQGNGVQVDDPKRTER